MTIEEAARMNHRGGNNCAMSLSLAYAEKLGKSPEEAMMFSPKPRSEGGKCGAFLSGKKILEQLNPEAVPEFEHRFVEMYGHTECASLIASHRRLGKNCNDFVGETARLVEELSGS